MDPRTIICGVLAGIALTGSIVLRAMGHEDTSDLVGAAGTFGGFVVGLYSSPRTGTDA